MCQPTCSEPLVVLTDLRTIGRFPKQQGWTKALKEEIRPHGVDSTAVRGAKTADQEGPHEAFEVPKNIAMRHQMQVEKQGRRHCGLGQGYVLPGSTIGCLDNSGKCAITCFTRVGDPNRK